MKGFFLIFGNFVLAACSTSLEMSPMLLIIDPYLFCPKFQNYLNLLNKIQPIVNPKVMDKQHGFQPGRSTTCNAVFCNHILKAFNAHSQIDVIYTDFAKAFDRVDHLSLICILKETG